MKTLLLGLAALSTACAAAPEPAELFGHIGADYKKPRELPDSSTKHPA